MQKISLKPDPARAVFKMLECQYLPVQSAMTRLFSQSAKGRAVIARYNAGNYAVKISMLDRFVAAGAMGVI